MNSHPLGALWLGFVALFGFFSAIYSQKKNIHFGWTILANVVAMIAPVIIYDLLF
jgi:hypothetical protein